MFNYNTDIEDILLEARESIFINKGYFVIPNYINNSTLVDLQKFWINPKLKYQFHDKIDNRDVSFLSPPYSIIGSNASDIAYCTGIWNEPIDCVTHEIAISVAISRNLINGLPIYNSIVSPSEWLLQYRVCRTCSNGISVGRHKDFMQEFRRDPTGSHEYDPSRLQATLLLSTQGVDFQSGGFYIEAFGKELFTDQMGAKAGDLIIWRYNLSHGVKDTKLESSNQIGFLRIIYPLFQMDNQNV